MKMTSKPFGDFVSPPKDQTRITVPLSRNQHKLKAYIASSSYNRTNVKLLALLLAQHNVDVTSTWAYTMPMPDADMEIIKDKYERNQDFHYYVKERAEIDFSDIDRSDFLVMQYPWGAGTASEVAYAVARNKPVFILCDFSSLDDLPLSAGLVPKDNICFDFSFLLTKIKDTYANNISQDTKSS